jgi:tryptophan synthase alpha chain
MSRIQATLAALKSSGRKALIPYVTAGDPFADSTPQIMQALADGGADIIELGVPFSDPMADGPVIQKASERALSRGIGAPQVLAMVRAFRLHNQKTPVVLMGYARALLCATPKRRAWTASWWWTTRPKNAKLLPRA